MKPLEKNPFFQKILFWTDSNPKERMEIWIKKYQIIQEWTGGDNQNILESQIGTIIPVVI